MAQQSTSRSGAKAGGAVDVQTELEASLRKLIALRQQQQERIRRIQALLGTAIQRLAGELLPDLSDDACTHAAQLTGLDALLPPQPHERLVRERARLEARLRQLEAQELYQQAQALVDPETGQLTLRLHAARQRLRQAEDRLGVFTSHASIYALMERRYDTPEYVIGFWRLDHLHDYQEASRLTRLFGEDSFESLAARVRVAEAEHQLARGIRVDLEAQVREVHTLQEEVERRRQELHALEAHPTVFWQETVRGVLERAELSRLAGRTEDASVLRQLTLVSALRAKKTYLEELLAGPFQQEEQRLQGALARMHAGLQEESWRPWNPAKASGSEAAQVEPLSPQAARDALARIVRCMSAVYEFAGYDFVSLRQDPLWWDVFQQGQEDGSMLPSVRDFYEAHPGYTCDELGLPMGRDEDEE